tara:strand:- start:32 stop:337 length:306 start_codon:yes stop_codon:yes gene_type:complete
MMPSSRRVSQAWNIIKLIVFVAFIIILIEAFGTYGIIGFVLFCFLWAAVIIIYRFDSFMTIKHFTESKIWGKPLKDFEKGEIKRTKVKIIWRKKNETTSKN